MAAPTDSYKEFTLDNGLRVALQKTPTRTVSAVLRVHHGALNEKPGEEGLAHFLEHAVINAGSKKYAPQETLTIRENFGYWNAFTSLTETRYDANLLAEETPVLLDFVPDIVFNPVFDTVAVDQQRQRILREIADKKSSPVFRDTRDLLNAFYGEGSPVTYFVLGKEAVVTSATLGQLSDFHKKGYSPNNSDLIMVGALPQDIEELVERNFGGLDKGNGERIRLPKTRRLDKPIVMRREAKDLLNCETPALSSADLTLSVQAPSLHEVDGYAAMTLTKLLGGTFTSRLRKKVSIELGLAYGIKSEYHSYDDQGIIDITGKIDPRRADEAIDAVFGEMKLLRDTQVPEENLKRIKRVNEFDIATRSETNTGYRTLLELGLDYSISPEEGFRRLNAVTSEQIKKAAIDYLPASRADGGYVMLLRDPLLKAEK